MGKSSELADIFAEHQRWLGFGDIAPCLPAAAKVVMVELVTGCLMLGILILILANKIARRS
jgi:hypothetical protein